MTDSDSATRLWPAWCEDHPWLLSFLHEVANEARRFGQQRIHIFHVMVAWGRRYESLPSSMPRDTHGMSREEWLEFNIFRIGYDAGLDQKQFGRRPDRGGDPTSVESDVVEKLEIAREEAARQSSPVDERHFAVALSHPDGLNEARRAFGLPVERKVLAAGRDRGRTFVPPSPLTAILCAGETSAAIRHARARAPRPGLVMFRWWHHRHGGAGEREAARIAKEAGCPPTVVDPADLSAEDLGAAQRAGVIYLPGGWAEESFEALVDTPLLEAISRSVENGGVLVGNSGGAMVLGAGRLSRWESGDEPERLPLLDWLDGLVVAVHIREGELGRELRGGLAAFPSQGMVGVGHGSAVLIGTRPLRASALENAPGNESVLLNSPDAEPEVIQPAG